MIPKYSVIIPTYNREALLKKCLASLAEQRIPKDSYEVIVINDGSRDDTEAAVNEFRIHYPELHLVYLSQKNKGVAMARNRGIRQAQGEIVFFTDDDCVVPPDWLQALAEGYRRHPEVAGVGGWYEYPEEFYKKSIFVNYQMLLFYKQGKIGKSEEVKSSHFFKNPAGNTSNMSYRKSVLEKLGGFDEKINFTGLVDWELKKRISNVGHPLLYIPLYVLHLRPLGVWEVTMRFFNLGRGAYHLVIKNPEIAAFYCPSLLKYLSRARKISRGDLSTPYRVFQKNIWALRLMNLCEFLFAKAGWEYQHWFNKFTKEI